MVRFINEQVVKEYYEKENRNFKVYDVYTPNYNSKNVFREITFL